MFRVLLFVAFVSQARCFAPLLRRKAPAAAARPLMGGEDGLLHDLEAQRWAILSQAEREASRNVDKGHAYFMDGQLTTSLECYDAALNAKPDMYLPHRGIVLYMLDRVADAQEQFRVDIDVFESRFGEMATEDRLWETACAGTLVGLDRAQSALDSSLQRITEEGALGLESRKPFRNLLDVYSRRRSPEELQQSLAEEDERDILYRRFYTSFFLALLADVKGAEEQAKECLEAAVTSPKMNRRPQDYWYHVPRRLADVRGFDLNS